MRYSFIFGTRPEAIKLAPVIKEMKNIDGCECIVISTGQHKEMLKQVLDFYDIVPDISLEVMKKNQDLEGLSTRILMELTKHRELLKSDYIFVQGDTTTAFMGSLFAFYNKIKIAHVEAGLRSNDIYNPWPEEANRKLISQLADLHFAPTQQSAKQLYSEGVAKKNVYVTGNTVVDALFQASEKINYHDMKIFKKSKITQNFLKSRFILVTAHRRENFGDGLKNICKAILYISKNYQDVNIVFPIHLNPKVRTIVKEILGGRNNITLCDPVDYEEMLGLLHFCYFVLTDSGGIQEEAPSFKKPVLIMRKTTERTEAVEAGIARLVGTKRESIIQNIIDLLENHYSYDLMSGNINPFGDGKASQRIIQAIKTRDL